MEFVEADRIVTRAHHDRTTPRFNQQWSLNNTGSKRRHRRPDIGAVAAWNVHRPAPSVIVAIVDSGIRLTHSDLAGNL